MNIKKEVKRKNEGEYFPNDGSFLSLKRKGVFFSLFLFSFLLSGLVLFDRFLPNNKDLLQVQDWKVILEGNEYSEWPEFFPVTEDLVFKAQLGDVWLVLKIKDGRKLSVGDEVTLVSTKIFGSVLYILKNEEKIFPQFNLYSWFLFLPALTFILSFFGLFFRTGESFYQTIAVLIIMLLATFFFLRLLYN